MKISAIIACYNAADTLGVQIEALANQSWKGPWEVVVVDNRCTDNSMRIAQRYRHRLPELRIVQACSKQGIAHAYNVGVDNASGEAVLFCDADDMVGQGWLEAMAKALEDHALVACRTDITLLNQDLPIDPAKDNMQGSGIKAIWYPPYLPHAGSGTMGVRVSLHRAVGGFDETLTYLCDTDYCFRIQMTTREKLHFVPNAVMHIRKRRSLRGHFLQAHNYSAYNVVLFKRYRTTAPEPPRLWKSHIYGWLSLALRTPGLVRRRNRYRYAWNLGWQLGALKAGLRLRVPPV
jgi:glycosyltransferase involved in cell wall biosynthesis